MVAFETFHGLAADGVANEEVYEVLDSLTDGDGSTAHFDFDEFTQNTNQACSAKANAYAGTFGGGGRPQAGPLQREASEVAPRGGEGQSRKQARRHRLGVPKHPLQRLHRGARASQHLYGTAADNRIAEMTNHGPGGWHATARSTGSAATPSSPTTTSICGWTTYDLPSSQYWWWPERDDAGRELDQAGLPCWGERTRSQPAAPAGPLAAIVGAVPGASSLVPSIGDIGAFEVAGEVPNLGPAD